MPRPKKKKGKQKIETLESKVINGKIVCPVCEKRDKLKVADFKSIGDGMVEFKGLCVTCNVYIKEKDKYKDM